MLLRLMFAVPILMPLSMVLLNVTSFATGLMYEGRVKESAVKFGLMYATTIPAAARGDLNPFFTVLSQPG